MHCSATGPSDVRFFKKLKAVHYMNVSRPFILRIFKKPFSFKNSCELIKNKLHNIRNKVS